MPEPTTMMWVAVLVGLLAAGGLAWVGVGAWRAWRSFSLTRDAADALLDVHQAKLDATIAAVSASTGSLADRSDELGAALAELRADTEHLRWMLGRIPEARDDLRREVLDLLLPTSVRGSGAADG